LNNTLRSAYGTGRFTRPRRTIAETACAMNGAFTVDELAERVRTRDAGAGSTATVYRAVGAMERSGFLERVGTRDGSTLYARCGTAPHHHHVVCMGCGRIAHAECPLESKATTDRTDGFVITSHEVTLYGLCPACADKGGGG